MDILAVMLIAVASTADSLIIGLNFGVKKVHIHCLSNLFISALCFVGTFAALAAGRLLGAAIPTALTDILGGLLLLCFGLYMLYCVVLPPKGRIQQAATDPHRLDKDNSQSIEPRESLLVGLMLCLNNVGLGVGAGVSGLPLVLTPLICAICSFLFTKVGNAAGFWIGRERSTKWFECICAVIVIVLGIRCFY